MRGTIHGHSIDGDPTGLNYLETLKSEDFKTLIKDVKSKGKANFKYSGDNYAIFHASSEIYVVARVEASSGWF